ncbi:MAG: hypothetical protein IT240_03690, partial [Bacteroidia bacterium]|nr:hypothetical protein [Bacteroidia bacterium]
MAKKNISFTSDELDSLRSFYQQEHEKISQRLKSIKQVLARLGGGGPKKRGRKSSAESSVESELQAASGLLRKTKSRKRGRPAQKKVATTKTKSTKKTAAKKVTAKKAVPAKKAAPAKKA